jgi:hypothetical protein
LIVTSIAILGIGLGMVLTSSLIVTFGATCWFTIFAYAAYLACGCLFVSMDYDARRLANFPACNPLFRMGMVWGHFTVSMCVLATTANALLQRRDFMFNALTIIIVFATGTAFLALDLIQCAFAPRKASVEMESSMAGVVHKKNFIVKCIMSCGAVVVVMLCASSMPTFPSVPFSNAYYFATVVVAICMLQLVLPARYLRDVSDTTIRFLHAGSNQYKHSFDLWDLWPLDMVSMELFARMLFTFAVMCDTWAVKMEDSHPAMVPPM